MGDYIPMSEKTVPDWEGFSRAVLSQWPVNDIEGAELFELALKYGMIREIEGGFNPEEHDDYDSIYPEEGDPWYEYTFSAKDWTK